MKEEIISKDITRKDLENVGKQFGYTGEIEKITPIKTGHINETFLVQYNDGEETKKYIFQSINTIVFKQPQVVMANISATTKHIRKKFEEQGIFSERRVLHFSQASDGLYYYEDEKHRFWRSYIYVDFAQTYNESQDTKLLYNSGLAFGKFQRQLSDFPMETLQDTIPDFHNTEVRFKQLREAIDNDAMGRADSVQKEIEFFNQRKSLASRLVNLQKEGKLPLRVTHNDTKCNNVLIDNETGEGICVIDLDTVMPGLSVYDFGDAIRSCGTSAAEDEKDLEKVHFVKANFEAFTKGFIEASEGCFTKEEIDNMVYGAIIMTMECGSRFLADYLNGDKYFRTTREGHNLDRTRTQMKLVTEMEQIIDELNGIVQKEAAKTAK